MKGRTFDTFEVAAGNREAYEFCRRLAQLEDMGPALVLLLGPEACGKSHLLWSVAKQVRLSTIPAGLALITPQDFPDRVFDLVEDPRPLQGRRAMLLVDNLEGFESAASRLEAVIETFLSHQHPVLVASNVHPNRLRELSGPLRAKLARSQAILIEPRPVSGGGPLETYEKFAALEARIAELEQERESLQQKLGVAFASAEDLARESVAMEARVRALQEEADYAMAQQARAQIALSEARYEQEANAALRQTLADREKALAEAEARVADGLARLEAMRQAHTAHRDEVLSNLNAMAGDLAAPEHEAPLLQALAEAGREQAQVRAALSATRERLKCVEFEWEKTRKVLAIQTAEMDALRYAAAGQVASATIQAGELEHRIDMLDSALDQVEAAALEAARDLPEGLGALRNLRAALEHMQREVRALKAARSASTRETGAAPDELSIFETDFFEVLPEDFHIADAGERQRSMPGLDAGLKDALRGKLSHVAAPAPEADPAPDTHDETGT